MPRKSITTPKPAAPRKAGHVYKYKAEIDSYNSGIVHHFVAIPVRAAKMLKAAKIKRLIVTLNGRDYRRAVQGRKDGTRHVFISLPMLRELGVQWGETVNVVIKPDPNPNHVDICEEFQAVLDTDEDAQRAWNAITVGAQRSYAHYINDGKSEDTRITRGLFMIKKIITEQSKKSI